MLKLNWIFKNGMVIRQNTEVRIFGETNCQGVEVVFENEIYQADIRGNKWIAHIKTGASGKPVTLTVNGYEKSTSKEKNKPDEQVILSDVLLGEVWLAGGQSNMELELRNSLDGEKYIRTSDFEQIRFINVPKLPIVDETLIEAENNTCWNRVKGENIGYMSAVAFHFAIRLQEELKVPIGIIGCNWGGTSATCWMGRDFLPKEAQLQDYVGDWDKLCSEKSLEEYDLELDEYNSQVEKWQNTYDRIHRENPEMPLAIVNKSVGDYPWPPPRGGKSPFRPFGLHETMISRFAPFTLSGVIYYQGEEDAERFASYESLNRALIRQWRADFENDQLPFYLTQLPMYIAAGDEENYYWPNMRKAQEDCAGNTENTGIAVICDCGEYDNIHPIDKLIPGYRLADQVLGHTYGCAVDCDNMNVRSVTFTGNYCDVTFDNTYGYLQLGLSDGEVLTSRAQKVKLPQGRLESDTLYGFEICQNDDVVEPGSIEVIGESLRIYGRGESEITELRYGWFSYGVCNVYSAKGLPLMPLRVSKACTK